VSAVALPRVSGTQAATFWAVSLIAGGLNYLFSLLMGRESFLGPEGFGTLTALSALLFLDGVVTTAIATSTTYHVAKAAARSDSRETGAVLRQMLWRALGMGLALAAVLWLLVPVLTDFLHLSSPRPLLAVLPVLVITIIAGVFAGGLQGTLAFAAAAGTNVLGAVLRILFAIPLVRGGGGVEGAILAGFFATTIAALLAAFFLWPHLRTSGRDGGTVSSSFWEFLGYGGPTTLAFLGLTLLFTLDTVLAKHYLSAESAGLYGAVSTLGRAVYFATLPLTLLMFPLVTRYCAQGRALRSLLLRSGGSVVLLGGLITAAYALAPGTILRLSFGAPYAAAAPLLWVSGLFFTAVATTTWLSHVALATRRVGLAMLPLAGAALQLGLLIRFHDSLGAVLGVSLAASLVLVGTLAIGLLPTQTREQRSAS